MLTWLIFEHVYDSFANNDDFVKLTAIMLMQTRLNFQKMCYSSGKNDMFIKNHEISLRFKWNPWESLDENHEKEATTKNNPGWALMVFLAFKGHDLAIYNENQGEKHPTWSTWLNNNFLLETITFNNNKHEFKANVDSFS